MADVVTTRFTTKGMHCHSCEMLIEMTVGELEGVAEVRADAAQGVTDVTYDPDVVTVDRILDSILRAGYEANVAS